VTDRRLLYLNTHRLSAYAWRQGKLLPEGIFENNEADIGRFGDYLRSKKIAIFPCSPTSPRKATFSKPSLFCKAATDRL
jgi:hypothetical protein